MKTELANIIIDLDAKRGESPVTSKDIHFLVHSSRRSDIVFVFIAGDARPRYIIKSSFNESNSTRLANEFNILTRLASTSVKETIPLPLYEGSVKGHYMIVETALGDKALNEKLFAARNSKKGLRDIFSCVTEWLITLHAATCSAPKGISEFLDSGIVAESLDMYAQNNPEGVRGQDKGRMDALLEETGSLADCPLCPVLEHNDFSPYNIMYDSKHKRLSVFDWGVAKYEGIPLVSLLNFFVVAQSMLRDFNEIKNYKIYFSFSQNIHAAMPNEKDFLDLFFRPTWQNEFVRRSVQTYSRAVHLDLRLKRFLFLGLILRHLNHSPAFLSLFLERQDELLL